MKKIVLITGTSTGLGLKTAILFGMQGFKVYATMRNLEKKEALLKEAKEKNIDLHIEQLDVSDSNSIQKCIKKIIEQNGRIDILINNAGAGFVRTTEHASQEEIEWVTDVNYFSVIRTTKAVLPFMRKAKQGHIINISSVGGLVGQPFNELYCGAKFAVEGYTESLATYLTEPFGIKFSIVEPGGISSEFANSVLKNVEKTGGLQNDEYLPIFNSYMGSAKKRSENEDSGIYQSPEEVAQVVLKCALDKNPPLRIRTSEWANEFCHLKTSADPDGKKLNKEVIDQLLK
ncbi:SDR family oxidoreductase [Xanthovirga aplysinae]|uniref:SDR family oxidoreductase n=1 Tax=Xanthovirga aplysinae TaxID=2529853 RepID=UPI0012BCA850|nr:SDR family oxidoreductase [Xanthovirga aplysinae]MTI33395.1 SDR family oxidoreductase [Xanthovirga aplysinae]